MWLWKISTHLHIWVHEYFLKSHDQVYSDDGEGCPCCSPLQSYTCSLCWSTETSPEWRYLQYRFIKLIFQSDTVLYLYLFKFYSIASCPSVNKKYLLFQRNKSSWYKTTSMPFSSSDTLLLIPGRWELHKYLFLGLYQCHLGLSKVDVYYISWPFWITL